MRVRRDARFILWLALIYAVGYAAWAFGKMLLGG
jgi:hypothetical protein